LVRREPNPRDGRGTLAVITDEGRRVAEEATRVLNGARFGLKALDEADLRRLFDILRELRLDAADFA
jgi:DNA-binding MarR family transcriptional regulator